MKEFLFIGGPADGERRPLTEPRPKVFVYPSNLGAGITLAPEKQEYNRCDYNSGGQAVSFYLHADTKPEDIIPTLVAGYRRPAYTLAIDIGKKEDEPEPPALPEPEPGQVRVTLRGGPFDGEQRNATLTADAMQCQDHQGRHFYHPKPGPVSETTTELHHVPNHPLAGTWPKPRRA